MAQMQPRMAADGLTLRAPQLRAVLVPLRFALGSSAAVVREVPLVLAGGCAQMPDRPGLGLTWDEGRIARLPVP
jgi:L-alanine-DL-glutamate epimerase-like enolase superfamily enzyme